MKQICKKYAKICYPYAIHMLNICTNMQEYDKNMHKYAIVKYAQICTNMQKYAKNMHKYATICKASVHCKTGKNMQIICTNMHKYAIYAIKDLICRICTNIHSPLC